MARAKRRKKTSLSKFNIYFFIIFIITFLVSLYKIITWQLNNMKNQAILKEIEQSISVEDIEGDKKYNTDLKTLKEKNNETVAWLKVNGTNIEYPIVQAKDNDYYMNHNFNKEYNGGGWIFADYKNKLNGTDKNIVVYGHNMRDGSMFGTLKNILEENWNNNAENYIINFITENENAEYEVFSVYQIENEDYYIQTDFTESEFEKYIKIVKERSIKDFGVEITKEDNILTLSTCADNNKYRVVLHAKKI